MNLKSYDMKRTSTFLKLGLQGFVLIMTLYDCPPTPLPVCGLVCVRARARVRVLFVLVRERCI